MASDKPHVICMCGKNVHIMNIDVSAGDWCSPTPHTTSEQADTDKVCWPCQIGNPQHPSMDPPKTHVLKQPQNLRNALDLLCHAILVLDEDCNTLQMLINYSKACFCSCLNVAHTLLIDHAYIMRLTCARFTLHMRTPSKG